MKTSITKNITIDYSEFASKFDLPQNFQNVSFNYNKNRFEITLLTEEAKE